MSADRLAIFWAKQRRDPNVPHTFHPLLCHMIDVGLVTGTMWRTVLPAAARHAISAELGLEENFAGQWVSF